MKIRSMWLCFAIVFLFFITGCAGTHFGVQDKSLSVPNEFDDTEAAIASAEKSPGAKICPEKIAQAKDLARKGVETYWACRSAEGLAMLADARRLAKEAEACQPKPVAAPPPVTRPAPPPPPPPPAPPKQISLNWVYFENNKATLTPKAIATLDETVKVMKDNPGLTIELAGFTDDRGNAEYNLKLAQRRVQAVSQYLSSKGIAANRLKTVALGKSSPVADNKTEQGRAQNRRVEVRIIK